MRQPEAAQGPIDGDPPLGREVPHEIAGRVDALCFHGYNYTWISYPCQVYARTCWIRGPNHDLRRLRDEGRRTSASQQVSNPAAREEDPNPQQHRARACKPGRRRYYWCRVPGLDAAKRAEVEHRHVDAGEDQQDQLHLKGSIVGVARRLRDEHAQARHERQNERRASPRDDLPRDPADRMAAPGKPQEAQVHHQDGADQERRRDHMDGFQERKPPRLADVA